MIKGSASLSGKTLDCFCALFILYLKWIEKYPVQKEKINTEIDNFKEKEDCRIKKVVPDLGVFLANFLVSDHDWDSKLAEAYLQETIVRNSKWVIEKYKELGNITPDPRIDNSRKQKTIIASQNAFSLLLFILDYASIVKKIDDRELEAYYGHLNEESKDKILDCLRDIKNMKKQFTWGYIQIPILTLVIYTIE